MHALSGGLITGTAIALAAPAAAGVPAAMILVGGVGMVVSVTDFFQTVQIMKNETGLTPCIGTRLLLDVAGTVLSFVSVTEGVRAWRASGSALEWTTPNHDNQPKVVPYDSEFAARQLLTSDGRISVSRMQAMIPDDVPNTFVPSSTIQQGYKYQFRINDVPVELKWHSPDLNAFNLYGSSSNSGTLWTAQIKIDGFLLGSDGMFYPSQQGNLTHIPLAP